MSGSEVRALFDRLAQSEQPGAVGPDPSGQLDAAGLDAHDHPDTLLSASDSLDTAGATASGRVDSAGVEKMGERFMRAGLLTQEQVERTVSLQNEEGLRFGQAAVRLGFVSDAMVQSVLAEQYNYSAAASGQQSVNIALAIANAPFSEEAEAIRQLRAQISIRLEGEARISVAVLSPSDNEGRAYLASSLAVAFAQTGRRTLLVDANLRGRKERSLLGVGEGVGLSTLLAGRAQSAAARSVPGFPALAVLDSGPQPPNPGELLREPAFMEVLNRCATEYEVVIVNTPPFGSATEAQSIARQVDACVLVARKDVTLIADLEHAAQQLQAAGVRLLGTVYNEYDPDAKPSSRRSVLGRFASALTSKSRR